MILPESFDREQHYVKGGRLTALPSSPTTNDESPLMTATSNSKSDRRAANRIAVLA